uniref:DnaJ (Hsp40) homolog, subfamily C, member 19 n=1 Tax=Sinocyclocheilus anshuiensis TaxID=1608454 RepID=A0A671MML1_9TELE
MVAVGLTLAAAGLAGRYAMQAMKHMEPQVKHALEASKSAFGSGYYRGGFEPKMTRREASLILGNYNYLFYNIFIYTMLCSTLLH